MSNTEQLDLIKVKEELAQSLADISQSRSNYVLQHFVLGEHATPERQFLQCVLELRVKLFNIKRDEIRVRQLRKKIAASNDEDEKELLQLDIEEIELSLLGQKREAGMLYMLYSGMPKYTYQQLQESEEVYWVKRLSKQAQLDVDSTGRISVGNLDALRMAGVIQDDHADRFIGMLQAPEQKKELTT